MSDKPTSTFQSVVDSASGAVQSAFGSLTGNASDKNAGEAKRDKAAVEDDLSHATVKVPGASLSSSGAIAKDDPNRQEGSWNQTVGSAKETVGNLVGSEQLKRDGREQNIAGQGQEAQGQLNDLGSGIGNRVAGTVGGAVAGITGDRQAQAEAQHQHDVGKSQQRGAEHDIQRSA